MGIGSTGGRFAQYSFCQSSDREKGRLCESRWSQVIDRPEGTNSDAMFITLHQEKRCDVTSPGNSVMRRKCRENTATGVARAVMQTMIQ